MADTFLLDVAFELFLAWNAQKIFFYSPK